MFGLGKVWQGTARRVASAAVALSFFACAVLCDVVWKRDARPGANHDDACAEWVEYELFAVITHAGQSTNSGKVCCRAFACRCAFLFSTHSLTLSASGHILRVIL